MTYLGKHGKLSEQSQVRHPATVIWGLSSAGRASALQAEGHRFEPYRPHTKTKYGGIAQLARAHGSYPWCREFKSPFRYEFRSSGFPELLFLFHRKLRPMKQKALRWDAHSAQRWMVAKATAPRRENVPRHILFAAWHTGEAPVAPTLIIYDIKIFLKSLVS